MTNGALTPSELRDRLRKGLVKGPHRRGFAEEEWRARAADDSLSEDDRQLCVDALWVAERLRYLREAVPWSTAEPEAIPSYLRAVVALCNRETWTTLGRVTRKALEQQPSGQYPFRTDAIPGTMLRLAGGGAFSGDEVLQSVVDAAQFPLRMLLGQTPNLVDARIRKVNWAEVSAAMHLGISHLCFEDAWQDILWEAGTLVIRGKREFLVPSSREWADSEALSRHRAITHAFGRTQQVLMATPLELALHVANRELLDVVDVRREGKRSFFALARVRPEDTEQLREIALHEAAFPQFYDTLLDVASTTDNRLTLRRVLEGARLLASAMRLLARPYYSNHKVVQRQEGSLDALNEYVRVVDSDSLVSLLQRGMRLGPADARAVLEFFCYSGKPEQELWTQPWIPVGPGKLAPIFGALLAQPTRNIDRWVQQLRVEMRERGPAFERYARTVLRQDLQVVRNAVRVDVYPDGANIAGEQIDLLVQVGRLVIVGELKCAVAPTDREMWSRHRARVEHAVVQARRKAVALASNTSLIRDRLKQLPADVVVMPLVVLNSPHFSGGTVNGVAVADLSILTLFLRNCVRFGIVWSRNGVQEVERELTLYSTAEEVPDAAYKYFAAPPQLQELREALKWRKVPILRAAADTRRQTWRLLRGVVV